MNRLAYLSGALRVSTHADAVMGGPRSHVLGVIGGFRAAGWDVDTYIAGDRRWARRLGGSGSEAAVRTAAWRSVVADAVRGGAAAWNTMVATRELRDRNPDLLYERFASYQGLGRRLRTAAGAPWVLETSGPFFHEAKVERGTLAFTSLAKRRELGAYRSCDLLVCVSEPLRAFLVDAGVPPGHLVVVPNAVDVQRFPGPTGSPGPAPPSFTVGFVGTVQSWQGLPLLVDAIHLLRARGIDVVAQIIGAGSGLDEVRDRVRALGLGDSVQLVGQVAGTEIPSRISGFDVGFAGHLPLLDGGMYHSPLKLYEYMAMGKPVLASAFPDAVALVQGSGHGFLFEPGDVEALAAALQTAVEQRDASRAAAKAIAEHIRAEHSWNRRVADLLAELRSRGLV